MCQRLIGACIERCNRRSAHSKYDYWSWKYFFMILNAAPLHTTHNGAIKRRWHRALIKRGHSYRTQAEIVSRQTWFPFPPQNPSKSIGENRLVEVVGISGASVTRPVESKRTTNWRRTILTPARISPAPICYERKRMSKENELTVTYKSRHRRFRD